MTNRLGLAVYAGGNHVFYVAGVIKYLQEKGLNFDTLATYSAGGAIMPFVLNNNMDNAIDIFKKLIDGNQKNFYPHKLLLGKRPFPHDDIYANAVTQTIKGYQANNNVDTRIIVATSNINSRLLAVASFGTMIWYYLKSDRKALHWFFKKFKVNTRVIDFNELNEKNMITAILGTSTISPFIKMRKLDDGFMVDGVHGLLSPTDALNDCDEILAIHTSLNNVSTQANAINITPQTPISENPLNYTDSSSFMRIFEQGYNEGEFAYQQIKDTDFIQN